MLLSQARREILIKAILQAIPVFFMSEFHIPQRLCDELASHMAHFLWGSSEQTKKIYWVSWRRIGAPRHDGALGF